MRNLLIFLLRSPCVWWMSCFACDFSSSSLFFQGFEYSGPWCGSLQVCLQVELASFFEFSIRAFCHVCDVLVMLFLPLPGTPCPCQSWRWQPRGTLALCLLYSCFFFFFFLFPSSAASSDLLLSPSSGFQFHWLYFTGFRVPFVFYLGILALLFIYCFLDCLHIKPADFIVVCFKHP